MINESFVSRLKHAWNVFTGRINEFYGYTALGPGDFTRPDRTRYITGVEHSILASIYTRIAIDAAANILKHVKVDRNGRFISVINSDLNYALSLSPNLDQTGRAFIQDAIMSLFDEGCIAVVPVDTDINPGETGGYNIKTLRVGKVIQWYPEHVRVDLYHEKLGRKQEITIPKSFTAIIENPLYAVMNEVNSTLKRLIRKLSLLDNFDEVIGSGKLDLIIQLPYVIKTEARKQQADKRKSEIEEQLSGSKYGIAYTDGTERITQLNRPVENNFQSQVEYLTNLLYAQLGLTPEVFNGTANEQIMLNYHNRTIEPVLSAIVDEFNRKFLTKTARTQGQKIIFVKDPFKMIQTNNLADMADKFTRNEILTSNEFRAIIGMYPADDPKADELRNKNLSQPANPNSEAEGLGVLNSNLNDPDMARLNELIAKYEETNSFDNFTDEEKVEIEELLAKYPT
ncbi:MAG: phage portal protein [Endomicrobium sp.]|jgi:hypothetical protein|uniref:phage portal protein n=1 Tax=Candidatus Endomicrobiellum cubanum TaxID=3242325 RepID=UPI0028176423|nr:phage portal protein [Endomicrobium sp.]